MVLVGIHAVPGQIMHFGNLQMDLSHFKLSANERVSRGKGGVAPGTLAWP